MGIPLEVIFVVVGFVATGIGLVWLFVRQYRLEHAGQQDEGRRDGNDGTEGSG